jgi:hypothetical protein
MLYLEKTTDVNIAPAAQNGSSERYKALPDSAVATAVPKAQHNYAAMAEPTPYALAVANTHATSTQRTWQTKSPYQNLNL